MAVTPQTNIDISSLAQTLQRYDNFVICGHINPDGDCIGSQLALAAALRACDKNAVCVLASEDPIDSRLTFMPGAEDLVYAGFFDGVANVFIAVDVPTRERMGDVASALFDSCEITVTIDHHAAPNAISDFVYVDPDAASTTLLIWELAGALGVQKNRDIAQCCYSGLVSDTGRFQYQNTTALALNAASQMVTSGANPSLVSRELFQSRSLPSVHLEAKVIEHMRLSVNNTCALSWVSAEDFKRYDAVRSDAEPLVDTLRSIAGVRVACMLREQDGVVRGSIRAKDATDVAAVAQSFGGGGHRAAAGFTIENCSLEKAVLLVEKALVSALDIAKQ